MKMKRIQLAAGVLGALGVLGLSANAGAPNIQYEMVPHVVIPETIEYKPTPKTPNQSADTGVTSPYVATYVPFPSYMAPFPQAFYSLNDALYPSQTQDERSGSKVKSHCLPGHHCVDNHSADNPGADIEGGKDADVDAAFKQAVLERRTTSTDSSIMLVSAEEEKEGISLAVGDVDEANAPGQIVQTGLFCSGPAKSAWTFSSPIFKVTSIPAQSLHAGTQINHVGPRCATGISIPTSPYPPAPQYNMMMPQYYQLPNGMVVPVPQRRTPLKNLLRCNCNSHGHGMQGMPMTAPMQGMPMMPGMAPQPCCGMPGAMPGMPMNAMHGMTPYGMMPHGMSPYGMMPQMMAPAMPYAMPQQMAFSQPGLPIILQVANNGTISQLPLQMVSQQVGDQAQQPATIQIGNTGASMPVILVAQYTPAAPGTGVPMLSNPQMLHPQMLGPQLALLAAPANPMYAAQSLQSAQAPARLTTPGEKDDAKNAADRANADSPAQLTAVPPVANLSALLGAGPMLAMNTGVPGETAVQPMAQQQIDPSLLQQLQLLQQIQQLQQAQAFNPGGMPYPYGAPAVQQSNSGMSTMELALLIMALKDSNNNNGRKGLFQRIADRRDRRAARRGEAGQQDPFSHLMNMWCEPYYPCETAMRMPSKNAYPYGYFGASVGPQESACFGGYNNVYMSSVAYPAY